VVKGQVSVIERIGSIGQLHRASAYWRRSALKPSDAMVSPSLAVFALIALILRAPRLATTRPVTAM
jgi:hypothetical protein